MYHERRLATFSTNSALMAGDSVGLLRVGLAPQLLSSPHSEFSLSSSLGMSRLERELGDVTESLVDSIESILDFNLDI